MEDPPDKEGALPRPKRGAFPTPNSDIESAIPYTPDAEEKNPGTEKGDDKNINKEIDYKIDKGARK
ncbi:MAG: hypothetical protein J0I79_26435 [Mesorhizobium sp.]|uniref:hypothetical protein n=1 Tax=Mesorhizobium sp. TaxID=1871066 RepID=UPI001AC69AA1|nr:hypothetical protein [Mesorhizobium sp.]MBN9221497.1 hypothetical protein [Mesorhizobium sp.]